MPSANDRASAKIAELAARGVLGPAAVGGTSPVCRVQGARTSSRVTGVVVPVFRSVEEVRGPAGVNALIKVDLVLDTIPIPSFDGHARGDAVSGPPECATGGQHQDGDAGTPDGSPPDAAYTAAITINAEAAVAAAVAGLPVPNSTAHKGSSCIAAKATTTPRPRPPPGFPCLQEAVVSHRNELQTADAATPQKPVAAPIDGAAVESAPAAPRTPPEGTPAPYGPPVHDPAATAVQAECKDYPADGSGATDGSGGGSRGEQHQQSPPPPRTPQPTLPPSAASGGPPQSPGGAAGAVVAAPGADKPTGAQPPSPSLPPPPPQQQQQPQQQGTIGQGPGPRLADTQVQANSFGGTGMPHANWSDYGHQYVTSDQFAAGFGVVYGAPHAHAAYPTMGHGYQQLQLQQLLYGDAQPRQQLFMQYMQPYSPEYYDQQQQQYPQQSPHERRYQATQPARQGQPAAAPPHVVPHPPPPKQLRPPQRPRPFAAFGTYVKGAEIALSRALTSFFRKEPRAFKEVYGFDMDWWLEARGKPLSESDGDLLVATVFHNYVAVVVRLDRGAAPNWGHRYQLLNPTMSALLNEKVYGNALLLRVFKLDGGICDGGIDGGDTGAGDAAALRVQQLTPAHVHAMVVESDNVAWQMDWHRHLAPTLSESLSNDERANWLIRMPLAPLDRAGNPDMRGALTLIKDTFKVQLPAGATAAEAAARSARKRASGSGSERSAAATEAAASSGFPDVPAAAIVVVPAVVAPLLRHLRCTSPWCTPAARRRAVAVAQQLGGEGVHGPCPFGHFWRSLDLGQQSSPLDPVFNAARHNIGRPLEPELCPSILECLARLGWGVELPPGQRGDGDAAGAPIGTAPAAAAGRRAAFKVVKAASAHADGIFRGVSSNPASDDDDDDDDEEEEEEEAKQKEHRNEDAAGDDDDDSGEEGLRSEPSQESHAKRHPPANRQLRLEDLTFYLSFCRDGQRCRRCHSFYELQLATALRRLTGGGARGSMSGTAAPESAPRRGFFEVLAALADEVEAEPHGQAGRQEAGGSRAGAEAPLPPAADGRTQQAIAGELGGSFIWADEPEAGDAGGTAAAALRRPVPAPPRQKPLPPRPPAPREPPPQPRAQYLQRRPPPPPQAAPSVMGTEPSGWSSRAPISRHATATAAGGEAGRSAPPPGAHPRAERDPRPMPDLPDSLDLELAPAGTVAPETVDPDRTVVAAAMAAKSRKGVYVPPHMRTAAAGGGEQLAAGDEAVALLAAEPRGGATEPAGPPAVTSMQQQVAPTPTEEEGELKANRAEAPTAPPTAPAHEAPAAAAAVMFTAVGAGVPPAVHIPWAPGARAPPPVAAAQGAGSGHVQGLMLPLPPGSHAQATPSPQAADLAVPVPIPVPVPTAPPTAPPETQRASCQPSQVPPAVATLPTSAAAPSPAAVLSPVTASAPPPAAAMGPPGAPAVRPGTDTEDVLFDCMSLCGLSLLDTPSSSLPSLDAQHHQRAGAANGHITAYGMYGVPSLGHGAAVGGMTATAASIAPLPSNLYSPLRVPGGGVGPRPQPPPIPVAAQGPWERPAPAPAFPSSMFAATAPTQPMSAAAFWQPNSRPLPQRLQDLQQKTQQAVHWHQQQMRQLNQWDMQLEMQRLQIQQQLQQMQQQQQQLSPQPFLLSAFGAGAPRYGAAAAAAGTPHPTWLPPQQPYAPPPAAFAQPLDPFG